MHVSDSALSSFQRYANFKPRQRLGAFGNTSLVWGVVFANDHAHGDFVNGVALRGDAGNWEGARYVVDQLNNAIGAATGPTAQALVEELRTALNPIVIRVGKAQEFDQGIWGRSEQQDAKYINEMRQLKAAMEDFTKRIEVANVHDAQAKKIIEQEYEEAKKDPAKIEKAVEATRRSIVSAASDKPVTDPFAAQAQGAAFSQVAKPTGTSPTTYALIALGVLAAGGVAYFALSGGKKKLAGYRRRARRRSRR